MNEHLAKVEAIFHEAVELPPDQRDAFLQTACAEDEALRSEVAALLRASGVADRWLQEPSLTVRVSPGVSEGPGTVIGRYKLLQQIGEGGMGVVYMAEQREPVVRKVALKILKLGMDTNQVVARFEAERQALALMDHPNIAKVLDGGATDTGRPYFVMELVQGLPITQFCDEGRLPMRERLNLFLDVCSAVQHAHQKGIIHRDLKPTNILVTLHGDKPVAKVIDFGVAKAIQGRLTDKTLFTQFQQFIGTPAYMSPEQTSLSGLDVDTRSDIYALGVLLYELLTGKTPFDGKELLKAGLDEMRQIIREQEPPRPSTRLSTMQGEDLTTTARQRHTEPPRLIHLVRGDLDWIVMKCLEKDRARRYETANGLAMDVQRHLRNEPVVARPPTAVYRFQKLVHRNKRTFAAAGAVTMALVLGLALSAWMFFREKHARQLTRQAERKAEAAAAKSQEVAAYVKQMRRLLGDDDLEMANSLVNLGLALHRKGKLSEAEDALNQALAIQSKSNAEMDQARSLECLGFVFKDRGKLDDAEKAFRQCLALRKKVLGERHATVCNALDRLALALFAQNKLDEATAVVQESADAGSVNGQLTLALLYSKGRGVQQDDVESVKWLRKAADQNSDLAEFQLGRSYITGRGVDQDLVEAAKWYRKSAEHGRFFGMVGLAGLYATGRGVPKDPVEADRWTRRAYEACERLAETRDLYRLSSIAFSLAATDDSDTRNGAKAVELAEKAVRLSGRKVATFLDALAVAYAETRQFPKAVEIEREAISLANENLKQKEGFTFRLRLFETNTPFHTRLDSGPVIMPE